MLPCQSWLGIARAINSKAKMSAGRVGPDASHSRACPYCAHRKILNWGKSRGLPRYRCGECKRTFNPLSKTSLARLRHRYRWFAFVRTMVEQKSVRRSAEICGIDRTTALRWRKRFLACSPQEKASILLAVFESIPALRTLPEQSADTLPPWVADLLPTILNWLV